MQIFAHRGLWTFEKDQNSLGAIHSAFQNGLSVEIDLWKKDDSGNIWVGHDISNANTNLADVLKCWTEFPSCDLALNIKCDGLLGYLSAHFEPLKALVIGKYFAFDMSMPERYQYLKNNFPIAYRVSEFETEELQSTDKLIWLDSFESDWYLSLEPQKLSSLLSRSVVVSPELHNRSPEAIYSLIREYTTYGICLDSVAKVSR